MFYNVKEDTLIIQDIEMDYITFGNGTKPLIMIQGLNTNSINGAGISLAYIYRIFAKEYKVYLFDRRKNIPEDITVRDFAQDIAMAMDQLGIANADIFGVSQGGMIAQYMAIERPDLVRKMVLAVTLSRNNNMVKDVIDNWAQMTEAKDFKSLVQDMAVKMYSDAYIRKYKLFMPLLTMLQTPKDVKRFLILTKSCLTCDTYDELYKIKCPALVIGGTQDKIVSGEASIELAEKLGCELYMYNNLGHAAYEEAKDFNERVYTFFNS